MDIGAITAALAGIKSATDIAKIIKDSSSELYPIHRTAKLKTKALFSVL